MRIGIEAQRIFRSNKHGMDYVALEEIRQLQKIDKTNEYFIFVAPGEDECLTETDNFHIVKVKCPTYPLWEQVALPIAAGRSHVDMLHCTSNTAPLAIRLPLILTLHDVIFLEKREQKSLSGYQNAGREYRRFIVPKVIRHCRKIITVSNYEYKNIEKTTNVPRERLVMIYNGYNDYFRPIDNVAKVVSKYISEDGYFFFLGNTDPKKNTSRTLLAYSKYLERSAVKRRLLLADFSAELLDELLHHTHLEAIRQYVVLPGYIANAELPWIYNGAFAFLYPSLRESFGLPIIESMACGTPVITSNTSSMPEVGGEGALTVNPRDTEDIALKMLSLEKDEALYAQQKAYGLERARFFSWEKTARQLLKVYESIHSA